MIEEGPERCANGSRKLGNIVSSTYPADRFSAGILFGAFVGWFASAGVDYWGLPSSLERGLGLRLAIEAAASACLVLPRPLLLKTVFRSRRSVFVQDEDVRAMLLGRVLGVPGGIWAGMLINSVILRVAQP